MTNLEYLRMKLRDTDPTDPILADEELNEIIKENAKIKQRKTKIVNLAQTIHYVGERRLDDTYTVRLYNLDGTVLADNPVIDYVEGTLTFTDAHPDPVMVEYRGINWNGVFADAFETMAADYRALSSYTAINADQTLDDVKSFLLRMAKFYRGASGEIWT